MLSMRFKFGVIDCKFVATPLDWNVKLRPESGMASNPKRFRQIIKSLIYLTITRTNLSYPI